MRFDGDANLGEYPIELRKIVLAALIAKVWEVAPVFQNDPATTQGQHSFLPVQGPFTSPEFH